MENVVIDDNTIPIWATNADLKLVNCQLTRNGSALNHENGKLTVINSVIDFNRQGGVVFKGQKLVLLNSIVGAPFPRRWVQFPGLAAESDSVLIRNCPIDSVQFEVEPSVIDTVGFTPYGYNAISMYTNTKWNLVCTTQMGFSPRDTALLLIRAPMIFLGVNTCITHQRNRKKSKVRARVEHIFAFMENNMQGVYLRCRSLKRAKAAIGLMNITYNLFRLAQLKICLSTA